MGELVLTESRDIKYGIQSKESQWATLTKSQHKRRGFKISLRHFDLKKLAKNTTHCNICGILLDWDVNSKLNSRSPSLDVLNPYRKELVLDNVQIVCHVCNRTKQNRDMESFVEYCKRVVEKFA